MSHSNPQSSNRKAFAIKRNDGDTLTRADLQYDLLTEIFGNSLAVFTDPFMTLHGDPPGTKVSFRDLYVNTLTRSPRTSKALREKMLDTPEFGTDFAKMALLANVGRVNTTMAFFPEMRTVLRTYHPVPSLQKTDENLQDAPRIKNILKSCILEDEVRGTPSTPADILALSRSNHIPPTSIVNLIFVMANYSVPLAQSHFEDSVDFLDLFLPIRISSTSRARAFLWLCYHYLEGLTLNPFSDEHAVQNPGKIPLLRMLTVKEEENIDTSEEMAWSEKMSERRRDFQAKKAKEGDSPSGSKGERAGGAAKRQRAGSSKEAKHRAASTIPEDSHTPSRTPHGYHTLAHNRDSSELLYHPSVDDLRYRTRPPRPVSLQPPRYHDARTRISSSYFRPKTMLQHAWYISSTTDPLYDSDEEDADEHVRLDYLKRLRIINRLWGNGPTSELTDMAQRSMFMELEPPAILLGEGPAFWN